LTPFLTTFANFFDFFYFDGGSQLPQQILWNKFHIRCAYFSPSCTWSLNYSVLVFSLAFGYSFAVRPKAKMVISK
jgi:uncharacterized protein YybS (DUF2232 family)